MELSNAFKFVVRLVNEAEGPTVGWVHFLDFLRSALASGSLADVDHVEIEQDVSNVRAQLAELLRSEPPPGNLEAVYFGLFDAADSEGSERIGCYVAGVQRFKEDDPGSLCNPVWRPRGGYLNSAALVAVKAAELSAAAGGRAKDRELWSYAGQLGAALLVSRFASVGLFPGLRRIVGFDSGDYAEIDGRGD